MSLGYHEVELPLTSNPNCATDKCINKKNLCCGQILTLIPSVNRFIYYNFFKKLYMSIE